MKTMTHHIYATLAWVAVGIAALMLFGHQAQVQQAVSAEDALAHEVAVQCADQVSGHFDALAEGAADPSAVPSPEWDSLVLACDAAFDSGANYAEAEAQVTAQVAAQTTVSA